MLLGSRRASPSLDLSLLDGERAGGESGHFNLSAAFVTLPV